MKNQKETEYKKEIDENLEKIKKEIDEGKIKKVNDSKFNKLATKFMTKEQKEKKKTKKSIKFHSVGEGIQNYYYVDDKCIKCGICTKVCPVNNIEVGGKDILMGQECIMCLACVQNCPRNAIHLRGEVSANRYRNSNIKLDEIIESNRQV